MRLFMYLPGSDSLWKLRMLSILSWLVYSYSIIRIGIHFRSQWAKWGFFLIAVLNPYLIFYFSLARGYAPACAFIMLSLLMAAKHIHNKEDSPNKWLDVFLMSSVATFANFSALYFFIGLTSTYLLYLLVNKKLSLISLSKARTWLLLVAGTLIIAISAIFLIRTINELFFPGASDVINSLFGSLIESISYFDNDYAAYYRDGAEYLLSEEISIVYKSIGIGVALFSAIAFTYFIRQFFRTRNVTSGFWALSCCFGIIVVNIFLHIFFKTPYLFERAALIFYPPLILGLFCFVDEMLKKSMLKRIAGVSLTGFLVIIFSFNFYKSFSLTTIPDWPIQTDTKECLDYLEVSKPTLIGINIWHYSVLKNYYEKAYPDSYNFNYRIISDEEQKDSLNTGLLKFDYLLLAPPYNQSKLTTNWEIKLSFQESGAKVLKRKPNSSLANFNRDD